VEFSHALLELKNGKKIRRKQWDKEHFISNENDLPSMYMLATSPYNLSCTIFLSDNWLIENDEGIFEEDKQVNFDKAIKSISQNKRVKLSHWNDQYIVLDQQTRQLVLKHFVEIRYVPTYEDFVSFDWEVVQ
jgi:hypothetical protein